MINPMESKKMNNLMKAFLAVVALACLVLATACSTESSRTEPVKSTTPSGTTTAPAAKTVANRDNALVRVVQAVPDTSASLLSDNKEVFSNVSYKTITPYKEISDERHELTVKLSGKDNGEPLVKNSEGFSGGKHYTAIVLPGEDSLDKTKNGKVNPVTLTIVDDNLTPPPAGKASVRVINASPDYKELDIFEKGKDKKLFSGVNYKSDTMYSNIDPMQGTFVVRKSGDKNDLLLANATFEAGKIYTVILVGHTNGSQKLDAIMVEDHLQGADVNKKANYKTDNDVNKDVNKHKKENKNDKHVPAEPGVE